MGKQHCHHKNVTFQGILHHRQYPEKCFVCQDCQALITDYVTTQDMAYFHAHHTLPFSL